MAKLIVCSGDESVINVTELADAVYQELGQKDGLFAELLYVNEQEIKALNNDYRGVDKVTDVLSFPTLDGIRGKVVLKKDFPLDLTEDGQNVFIGSIAICKKRAEEQAKEYGHSVKREMTYLLCHGLLHLMGYDHMIDSDKAQMRALEDKIMSKIKVYR